MCRKAKLKMTVNRPMVQIPRQFLRRKVVKGPKYDLPLSADWKIGLFVELPSPKNFRFDMGSSNGLNSRSRKEKSRFGCWTSQLGFGK
jgi:hypothetical protein